MHSLVLLAALSSQITFLTARQGENYSITPQVQVTQDCLCQVHIITEREGGAGISRSQQRSTLALIAHQPANLSRLNMNITPHDKVKIIVTVSDGKSLHLAQQWSAEFSAAR